MQNEEPLQLEYSNPSEISRARQWQSSTNTHWLFYLYGLAVGSIATAVALDGKSLNSSLFGTAIALLIVGSLCMLPIVATLSVFSFCEVKISQERQRLLFPLIAVVFYPVAHMLFCKLVARLTNNQFYVFSADPIITLLPWLLCDAIATRVTWNQPFLGQRLFDWFIAGVAWPASVIALLNGLEYLEWSLTSSSIDVVTGYEAAIIVLAVMLATPLIVCVTFVDFRSIRTEAV